jgi:hypothetical protein
MQSPHGKIPSCEGVTEVPNPQRIRKKDVSNKRGQVFSARLLGMK